MFFTHFIELDMHATFFFTLYSLRHTLNYLQMHCAVAELHFAEFGAMFLYKLQLVQDAPSL